MQIKFRLNLSILLALIFFLLFQSFSFAGGEAEYAEGLRAYKARNYRTAAKKFEESLSKGNGAAEVYIYMAHAYAASGKTGDAVKRYQDAAKAFKGLPAAKLAEQCLARIDPKKLWRSRISRESKRKKSFKDGASFINRVAIIDPTIQGHPPVSDITVRAIKTSISRLPRHIYKILNDNNAKVFIGPNIIDKWPDALNTSKPGMEHLTLARERARCYGRDIYIWERPTLIGSKKLGPRESTQKIQREILYQFGHAVDDCLGPMWEDKNFRKEYDLDKKDIDSKSKKILKYYLQPNYKGCGEVIASVICEYLGGRANQRVNRYFPRSKHWVVRTP